ncbi:MAG TPA: phosphoadenylyl-sulfate reductase [Solirubrobacteraceae bacterium]|nr:phosphoadenylyl-sulfate reductase [Solirubrobacteraceae bacterium]
MHPLQDDIATDPGIAAQADPAGSPRPGATARIVPAADAPARASFDPATGPSEELTATLREAIAKHGEKAVLLCSFQKEESVLIDELLRLQDGNAAAGVRIVTIDTGVLFEETMQTWREFERRFGVTIEVQDASNRAGGSDTPWSGPEHCCSAAKVAALDRSLKGAEGWITGIRREQGPTRAGAELIEHDSARDLFKYNPLARWTDRDIWRRINERDLPYNPLHDQGYESIGCAPCTQPGSGREGRWAGLDKTECGLHVDGVR